MKEKAKRRLEKLIQAVQNEGISCGNINEKQYNFESELKQNNQKLKLQVFFGKKGIKEVLQGNKETELYDKVSDIVFGASFFQQSFDQLAEPKKYIGIDESGKGDYFGPLVIAAVFVDEETSLKLKKTGVKDSKQVTGYGISSLSSKIKNIVKDKFDVILISPEKYNQLYQNFGNLNKLLAWGHAKVLENLLQKNDNVKEAISDKFGNEKLIKEALQQYGKDVLLHQITKAEKYTAVAAASILARDKFNGWFDIQKRKYNIDLPKGSSNVEDKAKELNEKIGAEELSKLIKIHFKTTNKINLFN